VDKWQKKLGEEASMWHLLGVSCGAFSKISFKGDHSLFLMGFKAQNPTLLGPKYKVQNPILLGLIQGPK